MHAIVICSSPARSESCYDTRNRLRRKSGGVEVVSRPIWLALDDGLITSETSVFDYGCGRGDDIRLLQNRGIQCEGWDPAYQPQNERIPADVVNLGYVINVIEDPTERVAALRNAWALAQKVLVVSARLTVEASSARQMPHEDGCLTRLGTFQKYYEQRELREWIDQVLGVSSVPTAPGIFYVFRDAELQQSFVASRYRRQVATPRQRQSDLLFEQHKALFEPLIAFLTARGPLEYGILNSIPNTELNGYKTQRLANTSNITFHGIESEALLILLDKEGISASSGSACLADSDEPSHVIKAMKPESAASRQMIRFSLDVSNSPKEIEQTVIAVQNCDRAQR